MTTPCPPIHNFQDWVVCRDALVATRDYQWSTPALIAMAVPLFIWFALIFLDLWEGAIVTGRPANVPVYFSCRGVIYDTVPVPMRVSDEVIKLCQHQVEWKVKRFVRTMLLPIVRWRSGAWEIGEGFHWGKGMSIANARIGRFCFVGPNSSVAGPVSIGDLTMVSANVTLVTADGHGHRTADKPMRLAFATTPRPVTAIQSDCWVGFGAILLEGITLGRGTVVAAGAVVTHSTKPYSIMAGNPARQIGSRFNAADQRTYEALLYGQQKG